MTGNTLIEQLGYRFADPGLLQQALTHRSAGSLHNERLEFLGDAIVNLVIADALFQRFPASHEGDLSRKRSMLVSGEALAQLARKFELGSFIHLGLGEIKTGGTDRDSILSCAMEAIIGAMYLDGGYSKAQAVILDWYEDSLAGLPHASSLKDPKTRLQEWLQAKSAPLPVYRVVSSVGSVHAQTFTVSCKAMGKEATAEGTSRRRAEQAAAVKLFEMISHEQ